MRVVVHNDQRVVVWGVEVLDNSNYIKDRLKISYSYVKENGLGDRRTETIFENDYYKTFFPTNEEIEITWK